MATKLDHYRLLGNSGLRVSPLCLGTMTFGEDWGTGTDKDGSRAILDAYADRGGNFLDTADIYTNGSSETITGELLKGRRDEFVLATKYTFDMSQGGDPNAAGNHRKNMVRSVEGSLRRLKTDYIDLYWVHAYDGRTPVAETMRALDDLVRQGKVLYVGVSDFPAWKVAQANTLAELRGLSPFVALQVEYSLVERTTERDLLPMARDLGLGVTPWSPLGQGVLTGKFLDKGDFGDDSTRLGKNPKRMGGKYTNDDGTSAVRAVVELAKERGVTPSQVALAWLLHQPGVTAPIVGARRLEHVTDNLDAVNVDLSGDDLSKLDDASAIKPGFPHEFLVEVEGGLTAGCTVEKR